MFESQASTSSCRSFAKTPSVSKSFLSSKYSLGFILSTNGIFIKSPDSNPPFLVDQMPFLAPRHLIIWFKVDQGSAYLQTDIVISGKTEKIEASTETMAG